MQNKIRIDWNAESKRFHRFGLISWWDQKRLKEARVLVIGVGAVGNEILKNLALLGVGNVLVADLDMIENSNLSRSVLYRESDIGRSKAVTATVRAKEIYPEMNVHYFDGNIIYDLGAGVYNWADVVLSGIDSIEGRLSINKNCWRVGKPWINGGIEVINGGAAVFDPKAHPDGPCYECTLSQVDWNNISRRQACNLLNLDEMLSGKSPTTPTISSIIAGIQCQEAIKYIHELPTIAGKRFHYDGVACRSYSIEYTPNEDCNAHDPAQEIISLAKRSDEMSIVDLHRLATETLGEGTQLELGRAILEKFVCQECNEEDFVWVSLDKVRHSQGTCPTCYKNRKFEMLYTFHNVESFANKTFAEIGVPKFDIVWARNGATLFGFEFTADAQDVLGPLGNSNQLKTTG